MLAIVREMETTNSVVAEGSGRICFLDNLRAFVIILVVVLHGAITYMSYAPDWWYVVDAQHSLFFTALVLLVDAPIMMVMFFVAGYFLPSSLVKRDQKSFLKDKLTRIGAPWVAGVLLLTPPTAYLTYYSRHVQMGLFRFWATDFWGVLYQQSVYWFLGILLFLFIGFSVVYRISPRLRSIPKRVSHPTWKTLGVFWASMTLGMFIMRQLGLTDGWFTHWYVLVFQPIRAPLYLGYFALGIFACTNSWFTAEGYKPRLAPWFGLLILSALLYLGRQLGIIHFAGQAPIVGNLLNSVLFNALSLASLMTGAAFFQSYVNGAGRLQRNLAHSSYGIYYIHPLILYPLTYSFLGIAIPLYLKAAVVIGTALLLSWAVSALILRKTPILRRIF